MHPRLNLCSGPFELGVFLLVHGLDDYTCENRKGGESKILGRSLRSEQGVTVNEKQTRKGMRGRTNIDALLMRLDIGLDIATSTGHSLTGQNQFKNDRVVGSEERNMSDSKPADGCVGGDVMDRQEKADIQSAHRMHSIFATNVVSSAATSTHRTGWHRKANWSCRHSISQVSSLQLFQPVVLDLIGLLEKATAGPSNKNILFRVSQIDKETVSLLKDHAIAGPFVFSALETKSRLFAPDLSEDDLHSLDRIIKKLINASPVLNILTLHELCLIWLGHNDEISPRTNSQMREETDISSHEQSANMDSALSFLDDMTARISTLLPFDITPDDIDGFVAEEEERALAESGSSLQFGEKSDNLRMKLAEFETRLSLFGAILSTSFPSLPTNLRVTTDPICVSSDGSEQASVSSLLVPNPTNPFTVNTLSPICFDGVSRDRQCGRITPSRNDTNHATLFSFPATLTVVPWRRSSRLAFHLRHIPPPRSLLPSLTLNRDCHELNLPVEPRQLIIDGRQQVLTQTDFVCSSSTALSRGFWTIFDLRRFVSFTSHTHGGAKCLLDFGRIPTDNCIINQL
ncbi:hypothetical protein BLNAU_5114 [Blattamonas nauphoetae]|uniref:Uncharacterized protein n=1 Tax=Blattamonas nauphoetae TaxID=2049346 RepID=A0ABQ9Y858_9EUKA|nr:hypothetical protein BLNAU_5114 [Blattamonas nauphoetae]